MLRKLSAILVICVGLLAISSPVAACALASLKSDCCPAGAGTPPCGEEGTGSTVIPDTSTCCLEAPSTCAVVESSRVRAPLDSQGGGPDPRLALFWILTLRPAESILIPLSHRAQGRTDDASLTYLRTLRLRL